ncbi:hypothetical protein [Candidatus Nephthysia bennettiae]|uniref:Uncharacterized protein n=1 Tax=Candidatus Nephthysia bennettiae TaxID=3127016 RepID=A0A934NEI9_9BACT|nr:hypothetical protein [Candidatus Dormibacteraeota bacterium]MBJ7611654.1 hypothetical protein [Candidatus Dormibacteraeota bacterium]
MSSGSPDLTSRRGEYGFDDDTLGKFAVWAELMNPVGSGRHLQPSH